MTEAKSSYRQIIKSTSVFGGVQFFTILISLLRSKCIALFVGPVGIGIIGLFNITLNLISSLTNAGLEMSAVKNISAAENNPSLLAKEIVVLKRLVWITGILGTSAVAVFSPLLSQLTFGNYDYTLAFVFISGTLLFRQLTNGELVILQGLRKIKLLAKANLIGNLLGLLISVPLYFYFGIDGIVPSLLLSSLVALVVAMQYQTKLSLEPVTLSNKEVFSEGRNMVKLGMSLSVIGLLTAASSYVLQIFISHYGTLGNVGLYNAGFTILNTYVGVIFTAMATDYYPRLSKICNDSESVKKLVTHQATIAVLLITPIIVIFLALAPNLIKILYTKEFLPIVPLVCWGILGMIIKAVSWSMGYILIAKGDSRMFIKTSVFFNSLFLVINILGYYFYGLEGLGITFAFNYGIHFLGLKIITAKRYGFHFDTEFYKLFSICSVICGLTFLSLQLTTVAAKYTMISLLIGISIWFSLAQLDKRLLFKEFFRRNK